MDLVTPTWVTALRGIGVVCNIYNIAKTGDDVMEGLEEKMGWNDRRKAKKDIKRHYNGRVAELNSECKDTIKMMKKGNSGWIDKLTLSEPNYVGDLGLDRVISDEPDRSQLIHDTAKGIQEMKIRIERHNKLLTNCESKIADYIGTNDCVAKRYIAEKIKLEKSREDHELHLVTLDMCIGRMQIEGHDRERFDLTPVYDNAAKVLKSMDVLLDYGAHRNALSALGEHESKLELEREIDRTAIDSNIYDSEVDVLFDQYQLQNRAEDSARATATKKSSDLENLVSKARAVGV